MHNDPLSQRDDQYFDNPYRAPKSLQVPADTEGHSAPVTWPLTYASSTTPLTGVVLPGFLGCVLVAFGLIMFVVHLMFLNGGQMAMHLSTTMPIIGGVFSLMGAWSNNKAIREVRLWPQGIELIGKTSQTIPWQHIHDVRVADSTNPGTMMQKVITLAGADNEPVGKITGVFKRHGDMLSQIRGMAGITENPAGEKRAVSAAGKKKGRRTALITGVGTLLMGTAGIFLPLQAYWRHEANQLMASSAVAGTGTVTNKLIAPNGRTRRIHYSVTGTDGTVETHNVEVTREFYDSIHFGDSVAIRYVPDRPDISELVVGQVFEDDITDTPMALLLMGIFGIAATCFMLPIMVLSWKGYDVDFNKGRFKIVPLE
ncbi:hypothetical protein [Stieleria varia]|uniref:DUF3592 domain-containing protein n=1 Tax=Stieleria varia TaxID=2528005 RepID=A0A5C6A141_9BACT|nr:hypothetical protein [Stieleria varia]TWT93289.1 hypothetical protein Pla52n_59490 [Stieleria varia]